ALHTAFVLAARPAAPATPTLSLHDALPICRPQGGGPMTLKLVERVDEERLSALERLEVLCDPGSIQLVRTQVRSRRMGDKARERSEEHTSELQSRGHLVCRVLLG